MKNTSSAGKQPFLQGRELTWLKFNERVLAEADCDGNPLLERLKFISIYSSNLDEFYMVRVGSILDYLLYAPGYRDNKTGKTAEQQLAAIYSETARLYAKRDEYFRTVTEALSQHGVCHLKMSKISAPECRAVEKHFVRNILPLLSPQVIDSQHPFPHLANKQLHVAAMLEFKSKHRLGMIAVPETLSRVFYMDGICRYVLLEDIICHFAHLAFSPYTINEKTVIAVTRNADINTEEQSALDEDIDYRQFMKTLIKKRRRLAPLRLEFQDETCRELTSVISQRLGLKAEQLFVSAAPLELSYCFALEDKVGADLKARFTRAAHLPAEVLPGSRKSDMLRRIEERDVLLSYPFESMSPFVELLRQAAEDSSVLSIKITLYRIDNQSRLAELLMRAADNGKEVIVLIELRARFDEANNIEWAQRLDEAGCRVIYGPSGYKVHSKICLITRREFGKIHHITQVGTGNYNEKTAKQYTDFSLLTANAEIGRDAAAFFNSLLLGQTDTEYSRLWVAPNSLKSSLLSAIEFERDKVRNGEFAQIIIKCNSLTDKEIIEKLVEAAQSGVKISMLVRGICCLIPGVAGFTENIRVVSIVGQFLEHSRIFCFGTDSAQQMYISSADLMTRNTERRIEVACPILDKAIRQRIYDMLEVMLMDNTKAWEQSSDGEYTLRRPPVGLEISSQKMFALQAKSDAAGALSGAGRLRRRIAHSRFVSRLRGIASRIFGSA